MKIARLYLRVSTREQHLEGYSIQAQKERLISYCKAKDYIIEDIYIDGGYSGSNLNRPAMNKLLQDIETKETDIVVVYKLDRISRSQKDTLFLIEDVFLEKDISFVSMQESFDTDTPFGRAMVGILSVFAQLERENIKERSMMGKEERAKEGLWGGGVDPYGYDYVNGRLIPNDRAGIVKKAFELYIKGHGTPTISRKLGNIGRGKVRGWLIAPIYAGKIAHNGNIYPGEHEPIIEWEDFLKVNKIMEHRSNKRGKPVTKNTLAGLVKCKRCGALYGARKNGRYYYLTCYSRSGYTPSMIKDKTCRNKNWRLDRIMKVIEKELFEIIYNEEYLSEELNDEKENENIDVEGINREIKSIDSKINRAMDLMLDEDLDIADFKSKIAELKDKRIALQNIIENEVEEQNELLIETIDIIKTSWHDLEVGEKNELLRRIIKNIWIDGENISIKWSF